MEKIILHPLYDAPSQDFDFAIVTLKNPIPFSSKANAACLPIDPSESYADLDLIVSGWGNLRATGQGVEYPTWLQVK